MKPREPLRGAARLRRLAEMRDAMTRAAGNAALLAELRAEIAALKRPTPPAMKRMSAELAAISTRLHRVSDVLTSVAGELKDAEAMRVAREADQAPRKK